jgi:hypothetical protein
MVPIFPTGSEDSLRGRSFMNCSLWVVSAASGVVGIVPAKIAAVIILILILILVLVLLRLVVVVLVLILILVPILLRQIAVGGAPLELPSPLRSCPPRPA